LDYRKIIGDDHFNISILGDLLVGKIISTIRTCTLRSSLIEEILEEQARIIEKLTKSSQQSPTLIENNIYIGQVLNI
jgi:hypothetical protein